MVLASKLSYNVNMGKVWNMSDEGKAKIRAYAQERYKNSSVIVTCKQCSKQSKIPKARFEMGRGKYCSKKCKGVAERGIRQSPQTEFKKGMKAWNKGIEWHNHNYKGDNVGLRNLHTWVERRLGKPSKCEHCGNESAKRYEWSNISREYKRELSDWQRLCTKCHMIYDGHSIINNRKLI